jgi:lysophospholipid acyltransferase (LPLAT)-like uncharacterized protein
MAARQQRQARRRALAAERDARTAAGRNAAGAVRWRRWRRALGGWLLATLGPWLCRGLAWTWRVRRIGAGEATLRGPGPWLVAMWHGRMLALMPLPPHCRRGIGVLVSPSDDGSLATLALRHFDYRVVRGSLNRGGARALREMHAWLQAGGQLVLTPDGPRGPAHTMNSGVGWLLRASGAPLLLVGVAVDRAWRLRSWDRFVIPKPFARIVVHYDAPRLVAADTDDATLEAMMPELGQRLLQLERDAFAALGCADDHEQDAAHARPPGP